MYSPETSIFAYWMMNGVRVADRHGRAKERVLLTMEGEQVELVAVCETNAELRTQLYWYGHAVDPEDDSDGDGYTFAQEIAAGTDPLMADRSVQNGVAWADGEKCQIDLQTYEQLRGAVVDDGYCELFYSSIANNAADCRIFGSGGPVWPVVTDVTGDGVWDLIVVSETETNVFINVGEKGNPKFVTADERSLLLPASVLEMNSVEQLSRFELDLAPAEPISVTEYGATLLVSDASGRIWCYESGKLRNTVWGGSYAGFAQGLRLAAVDWEDDGDLDCLCGTADGKLMLLRDPKVGRPTGLTAAAGVDNVKLTWDPNAQSRVRGYKVYRGEEVKVEGEGEQWNLLNSTPLPTYRDTGLAAGEYAYKVSALSRFYTAGNSTPTETESVATEPVTATVGGDVPLYWLPTLRRWDDKVIWRLAISNAQNFAANDLVVSRPFAPESLRYVAYETSGILSNVSCSVSAVSGCLTLTIEYAESAQDAGRGVVFTFVFDNLDGAEYDMLGDVNLNGNLEVQDQKQMKFYIVNPARLKPKGGDPADAAAKQRVINVGDLNGDEKLDGYDFSPLQTELRKAGVLK